MEVPHTFCNFELEAEIIFDFGGHHYNPSMVIIFTINALHLSKMSILIGNMKKFKDNIPIKDWWKTMNLLNFYNVVV
jgi:hypothetical protein